MRSIAIVSGKGGVGKTSTAINLGIALSSLGKNILIVDANISTPDVGLSLGAPIVPFAMQHVLSKKIRAEKAIYRHHSGTKILPASLSFPEDVDLSSLKETIDELKKMSEIVLVDCAAGINKEVLSAISAVDECLIVTNPEMPALASALKTIKAAKEMGKRITGVLITKANGKTDVSEKSIQTLLDSKILGIVPEDRNMRKALMERDAIIITHPKSKASKSYRQIARLISGKYEETAFDRFIELLYDFKDMISG